MKLKNELTLKRLQKEYAKQILSIMGREEVSFLEAKIILNNIINSEEVKEMVIREI